MNLGRLSGTLFGAAGLLLGAGSATAQIYTSSQYPAPFVPLSGATVLTLNNNDDDGGEMVELQFDFPFFGRVFTHVNVGTNGLVWPARPCADVCDVFREICNPATQLCAATSSPYSNAAFPSENEPVGAIGAFWDDLYRPTGSPAQVLMLRSGAAPNRVVTIEWRSIQHLGGTGASTINFQIRLNENGRIQYHYGPANGAVDNAFSASVGLENAAETEGLQPLACTANTICGWAEFSALTNQVIEIGPVDGPELIGSLRAPPGADPGAQIRVNVRPRNIGTRTATAPTRADVYLSTDPIITTQDTLLGRLNFAALPASAVASATLTTNLPAILAPGEYRIGALIDATNVVREASETNNTALSDSFLVGPELSLTLTAPASSGPGESFPIALHVSSIGSPVTSAGYELVLSADQTRDPSDTRVGTGTVTINGQARVDANVVASIPESFVPGDYYVLALIDHRNRILEVNEMNNTAASAARLAVIGPDVVAAEVRGPNTAFRGETYRVNVSVRNAGGARANGIYYSIHFSDNQLVTVQDPLLGEFGPLNLTPGQTFSATHDLVVSTTIAAGTWFLGLIADSTSVLIEDPRLQQNNIRRQTSPVIVRDPAPDFTAQEIRLPPIGAAGESLIVERVLENVGNSMGGVEYSVHLSGDATIDPMVDPQVGTGTIALGALAQSAGIDVVRLPVDLVPGAYYIGYVLDPRAQVSELSETNNVVLSGGTVTIEASQLSIVSRTLPPATVGLPYQFDLTARGGTGRYTWSISEGELPAGMMINETTGRVSGTPTREGNYPIAIAVDDGSLTSALRTTLIVTEPTVELQIITRAIPPAFVGRPYEFVLTALGGVPPYVWSFTGSMPPGLILSPEGSLTGSGVSSSNASISFQVRDALGATHDRVITVRVVLPDDALRFTSDVLRDGIVDNAYNDELRVMNGVSPYRFELASGELPPGLSITSCNVSSGSCVEGVPSQVGDFTFAVRVTDSRGDFDVNRFTVSIAEDEDIRFVTNSLPPGVRGEPYLDKGSPVRLLAVATGTTGGIRFGVLAGDLPPGLTLAASGEISGTPTGTGLFAFTAEAVDALGEHDFRALAIVIDEPTTPPGPGPEAGGCGCTTGEAGPNRVGWVSIALLVIGLAALFRRRVRLALVFGLVVPATAEAQVPYFLQEEPAAYVARTGGTPLAFVSQDDADVQVMLPFSFRFFDGSFNTIRVSTNGYLTFGAAATSFSNESFPGSFQPNGMIAPWWDDWFGPTVTTYLEGTAPTRIFIVQWADTSHLGDGVGVANYQVWLYEGAAARFEIRYGPMTGLDPGAYTGSVGFENEAGSAGFQLRPCGPTCTDVELNALSGRVLRALQDGGTELVATAVSGPSRIYAGTPFDVQTTIQSLHQNRLGPFRYSIHLLPAGGMVANNPVFTSTAIMLSPYATRQRVDPVTLPILTAPGRYRLALQVDTTNNVAEPDESNNVRFAAADFTIAERQPDFTILPFAVAPPSVSPGDTVTTTISLRNAGNLDGAAPWIVVVSPNRVITTDDRRVYSSSAALPALTTTPRRLQLALPNDLVPGRYYVGAIIDPGNATAELSEINNSASSDALAVGVSFLEVATQSLPAGYAGIIYSAFLTGSGGDGSYRWELASGMMPQGLALLGSTGEIRGTPRLSGSTTIRVRVLSAGQSAERDLDILIDDLGGSLTIVTRSLLPGVVGQIYPPEPNQRIRVVNATGTVAYSLTTTPPPGLELASDGLLSGVPLQRGVFDLGVVATDMVGTTSRTIPLTVVEPGRLAIVADALPDGMLEEEYRQQIRVVGASGTTTVSYSIVPETSLPDGLALTESGLVVGVPQRVGLWRFAITAREGAAANAPTDTANFSIRIESDLGFAVTPSSLPNGEVGAPYDAIVEARGGTPPFIWRLVFPGNGSLPRGLRFEIETNNGRERLHFAGTPEVATAAETGGAVSFLIEVEDNVMRRAAQPLAIRVVEPPPPAPGPADDGCGCRTKGGAGAGTILWVVLGLILLSTRRRLSR